jgi:hypothetical protein
MPVLIMLLAIVGCGGSYAGSPKQGPPPPPNSFPQFGHVVLVVEENHGYSQVIGNSAMPYLNNLASQYGLATQLLCQHPSLNRQLLHADHRADCHQTWTRLRVPSASTTSSAN